jgi:hypothetical protein
VTKRMPRKIATGLPSCRKMTRGPCPVGVAFGRLLNGRAGGQVLRVFLQSGLNCWFPLPGSGRREVGRLFCRFVMREGCRGPDTNVVRMVTIGQACSAGRKNLRCVSHELALNSSPGPRLTPLSG